MFTDIAFFYQSATNIVLNSLSGVDTTFNYLYIINLGKKQKMERKQIVAAYLRVSTDKQTILNQKSEVLNFCRKQDMQVTTLVYRNRQRHQKRK